MVTKSLRPSDRGEGDWQCPLTIPLPLLLHRGRGKLMSDLHHILHVEVKESKGPSLLFLRRGNMSMSTSFTIRKEVKVAGHGLLLLHYFCFIH